MILQSAGQEAAALPLIRESRELRVRRFGANHELVGDSDRLLGEILATLGEESAARTSLQNAVRLTRAGYGSAHSHTRRAEISLARFQANHDDAAALQLLRAWARQRSDDLEQRKASWLAGAYAAQHDCTSQPSQARRELDVILSLIHI